MTDAPRFDPLYSSHAIERCAWTLMFQEQVPTKLYLRLAEEAHKEVAGLGMQPVHVQGINFDFASGRVSHEMPGNGPREFTLPDGGLTLSLTPNSLTWVSARYVRWTPFFGQIEDVVMPLARSYLDTVNVSALKLEYWDRFVWSGEWSDFAPKTLITTDTGLVAASAVRDGYAWHSHSGWFEDAPGALRRLVNLNVSAADLVRPGPPRPPSPSVGIHSMIQDNFAFPGMESIEIDAMSVTERSQQIHSDLKALLSQTLSAEMQARISLNVGATV